MRKTFVVEVCRITDAGEEVCPCCGQTTELQRIEVLSSAERAVASPKEAAAFLRSQTARVLGKAVSIETAMREVRKPVGRILFTLSDGTFEVVTKWPHMVMEMQKKWNEQ